MNIQFSLFNNHLDLAHSQWKHLLLPGDLAVDATCGNGHDTLLLAELVRPQEGGWVIACDIQPEAIRKTQWRLGGGYAHLVQFFHGCHTELSEIVGSKKIKLLVYNLGYLPGGKKEITTQAESTIKSLQRLLPNIALGGAVSITCYPGHPEGKREEELLLDFLPSLSNQQWSCSYHRWQNRLASPSLILIQHQAPREES